MAKLKPGDRVVVKEAFYIEPNVYRPVGTKGTVQEASGSCCLVKWDDGAKDQFSWYQHRYELELSPFDRELRDYISRELG